MVKKKAILIGDDIRFTSGVATVLNNIVTGCSHKYDFVCVGGAMNHPEMGQVIDFSQTINTQAGIDNANVIIYPTNGYGNIELIRSLIDQHKPDFMFVMTDPRYYDWLFIHEREIRQQLPIIYYNIWDDGPAPLYNYPFYASCDALFAISKQTLNFNKIVLGDKHENVLLKYIPHGIDKNKFYPIEKNDPSLIKFKNEILPDRDIDFLVFCNCRNIRRKSIPDLILGFKTFLDTLENDKKDKCVLLLHTDPIDDNGTDLPRVIEMLLGDKQKNILISASKIDTTHMNYLYNLADVTALVSSNEGWGLSLTESLMVGTPIIANVTGGMQDQMRFEDENRNWIKFDSKFYSNHLGKYKKCGEWAFPIFPSNISLIGSVPTPYIFDDRCDFRDISKTLSYVYSLDKNELKHRGQLGREWVVSEESSMSNNKMCENIIEGIDELLKKWEPRSEFDFIKITPRKSKQIKYPVSL